MSSTMMIPGPLVKAASVRPKVLSAKFKHLAKTRRPVTGKSVHTKENKAKSKPGAHQPEAKRAKKLGHLTASALLPALPLETPHHPLRSAKLEKAPQVGSKKSAVRPVRTGRHAGNRRVFASRLGREAIRIRHKQVVSGKAKEPVAIKVKPSAASKAIVGTKPPVQSKARGIRASGGGHRLSLKGQKKTSDVARPGVSNVKTRVVSGKTHHPASRAGTKMPKALKPFRLAANPPGTLAPPTSHPVSHRASTGDRPHPTKVETPAQVPGWKIQAGPVVQQNGVKHSSWIIRPPMSVGQPMKLELTQEGSKLKADLTVSASQIASGLVNASPTALPHQAVHLPDGVFTLEFSLFSQGGNQAFSGQSGYSGGTAPYLPELERRFSPPDIAAAAGYGEGSSFSNGVDYRV